MVNPQSPTSPPVNLAVRGREDILGPTTESGSSSSTRASDVAPGGAGKTHVEQASTAAVRTTASALGPELASGGSGVAGLSAAPADQGPQLAVASAHAPHGKATRVSVGDLADLRGNLVKTTAHLSPAAAPAVADASLPTSTNPEDRATSPSRLPTNTAGAPAPLPPVKTEMPAAMVAMPPAPPADPLAAVRLPGVQRLGAVGSSAGANSPSEGNDLPKPLPLNTNALVYATYLPSPVSAGASPAGVASAGGLEQWRITRTGAAGPAGPGPAPTLPPVRRLSTELRLMRPGQMPLGAHGAHGAHASHAGHAGHPGQCVPQHLHHHLPAPQPATPASALPAAAHGYVHQQPQQHAQHAQHTPHAQHAQPVSYLPPQPVAGVPHLIGPVTVAGYAQLAQSQAQAAPPHQASSSAIERPFVKLSQPPKKRPRSDPDRPALSASPTASPSGAPATISTAAPQSPAESDDAHDGSAPGSPSAHSPGATSLSEPGSPDKRKRSNEPVVQNEDVAISVILAKPSCAQPIILANGRYQCPLCSKAYKHSKHVRRHIINHTKMFPFVCPVCHMQFRRRDACRRHLQNLHATSAESQDPNLDLTIKSYVEVRTRPGAPRPGPGQPVPFVPPAPAAIGQPMPQLVHAGPVQQGPVVHAHVQHAPMAPGMSPLVAPGVAHGVAGVAMAPGLMAQPLSVPAPGLVPAYAHPHAPQLAQHIVYASAQMGHPGPQALHHLAVAAAQPAGLPAGMRAPLSQPQFS